MLAKSNRSVALSGIACFRLTPYHRKHKPGSESRFDELWEEVGRVHNAQAAQAQQLNNSEIYILFVTEKQEIRNALVDIKGRH
jgi:hypothetical protein